MNDQELIHNRWAAESPIAVEGEELKVQEWRLEQFRNLGMSTLPALQCTIGKVDTHRARAYVAAGCPADLAAEILL